MPSIKSYLIYILSFENFFAKYRLKREIQQLSNILYQYMASILNVFLELLHVLLAIVKLN